MTHNKSPAGLPQGIYSAAQIPMADYLADPCVSPSLSSGACHTILSRSLQHAWASHPRLGGRAQDDSDASDMGTLMHDLLLGVDERIGRHQMHDPVGVDCDIERGRDPEHHGAGLGRPKFADRPTWQRPTD